MELFSSTPSSEPLASRMRPRNIDEYVGQDHILGEGRLLRRLIQADRLSSIILFGPPGTGKTTLAQVIANSTKSRFVTLNAVLSGIKDLREEIEEARNQQKLYTQRTTLFVDEVHRWNKAQQDALLPWVENGTVILIGATTENPYFEVNSALVSRSRIFQLKSLDAGALTLIARNAIASKDRGYGAYEVRFEPQALEHIVNVSKGDARTLLNSLELAVETSTPVFPPSPGTSIHVTLESAEESIQKKVLLYDKEGDYHFDTISAFIKSIRGSDPDAALYWMARMIKGGEDPKYIFRRMLISASEDIGMADPQALVVVQAAAQAFERVGMPEGQFHLAQSALYLSTAPKSNSALAYFDAFKAIEEDRQDEIPPHLKDANRDKKGFGHGEGYLYPHAYRDHWIAQQYLPSGFKGRSFYRPSGQGFEGTLKKAIEQKRELQLEAYAPDTGDILTFSPPDGALDSWVARTNRGESQRILTLNNAVFDAAAPVPRHGRLIIPTPGYGFPVWEALRRVPEGQVTACTQDSKAFEILSHTASELDPLVRPLLFQGDLAAFAASRQDLPPFETLLSIGLLSGSSQKEHLLEICGRLMSEQCVCVFCEPLVHESTRLSQLFLDKPDMSNLLKRAEDTVYAESRTGEWGADAYMNALKLFLNGHVAARDVSVSLERVSFSFPRKLTGEDLAIWFSRFTESCDFIDPDQFIPLIRDLDVSWNRVYGVFCVRVTAKV
ncbi:MAG: AAA family ATPase [Spirochaetales bacterium]|nr:AAA family ATPase [Spirochaetales bacterium]